MNLTCFNASGPLAQNATLLYNQDMHSKNLWERNGTSPLPQCSEAYSFLFHCLLCQLLGTVYVVCNNLEDNVKVALEASSHFIKTVKSECPTAQSAELGTGPIIGIVLGGLAFLLFIVAAVVLYRRYVKPKRINNNNTANGPSSHIKMSDVGNVCDSQLQDEGNGLLKPADEPPPV